MKKLSLLLLTLNLFVYSAATPLDIACDIANDTVSGYYNAEVNAATLPTIADVRAKISGLGAYQATFIFDIADVEVAGTYEVDGANFYIKVGSASPQSSSATAQLEQYGEIKGAELFGDEQKRYMVDYSNMSVTVGSAADDAVAHLLDNPNAAFAFTDELFDLQSVTESSDKKEILFQLTPKGYNDLQIDRMSVAVDSSTLLPIYIIYYIDGDKASIRFKKITKLNRSIKRFDKREYADFEYILFE